MGGLAVQDTAAFSAMSTWWRGEEGMSATVARASSEDRRGKTT